MGRGRRKVRSAFMEARYREYLRLARERNEFSRATREEFALVELPEPIRWGWERFFVLRPDVERSPERSELLAVLEMTQNLQRSHRKDFAQRDWKQGGKKRPTVHALRDITEKAFWALEPKIQRHFALVTRRAKHRSWKAAEVRHPWKFVSRVRVSYMTHRAIPNSEAVAGLKRAESKLYGPGDLLVRYWYRHVGDDCKDDYGRRSRSIETLRAIEFEAASC